MLCLAPPLVVWVLAGFVRFVVGLLLRCCGDLAFGLALVFVVAATLLFL
jgi:hypothetical protein